MARNEKGRRLREMAVEALDVEQRIRERAYELFVGRTETGGDGDEFSDWLQAEADVLGKRPSLGH